MGFNVAAFFFFSLELTDVWCKRIIFHLFLYFEPERWKHHCSKVTNTDIPSLCWQSDLDYCSQKTDAEREGLTAVKLCINMCVCVSHNKLPRFLSVGPTCCFLFIVPGGWAICSEEFQNCNKQGFTVHPCSLCWKWAHFSDWEKKRLFVFFDTDISPSPVGILWARVLLPGIYSSRLACDRLSCPVSHWWVMMFLFEEIWFWLKFERLITWQLQGHRINTKHLRADVLYNNFSASSVLRC